MAGGIFGMTRLPPVTLLPHSGDERGQRIRSYVAKVTPVV